MFNKKIYISKHCLKRFEERGIKFSSKKRNSVVAQILRDLKPLNVLYNEKLENNDRRVITRQGKVYIGHETETKFIIKTVYKIDIKKEMFRRKT